ncbi:MAG: hypothetical protein EOP45_16575 [Sphingobacteriaceae bacterium]|nr:MAG: hypothetical protein EOP45_16575 [Sphingobacteriaceae bacterium]
MNRTREAIRLVNEDRPSIYETDSENRSPLYLASERGFTELVKCIIEQGSYINRGNDDEDYTALHIAAHKGHASVVQLLLDDGANSHLESNNGNTALDLAKQQNCTRVIRLLSKSMDIKIESSWTDALNGRNLMKTAVSTAGGVAGSAIVTNAFAAEVATSAIAAGIISAPVIVVAEATVLTFGAAITAAYGLAGSHIATKVMNAVTYDSDDEKATTYFTYGRWSWWRICCKLSSEPSLRRSRKSSRKLQGKNSERAIY